MDLCGTADFLAMSWSVVTYYYPIPPSLGDLHEILFISLFFFTIATIKYSV